MMNNRNIDVSVAFGDHLSQDVAKYAAIYRQISFWGVCVGSKSSYHVKNHYLSLDIAKYVAIYRYMSFFGAHLGSKSSPHGT